MNPSPVPSVGNSYRALRYARSQVIRDPRYPGTWSLSTLTKVLASMDNTASDEQLDAERHPDLAARVWSEVARWLADIPLVRDRSVLLDYGQDVACRVLEP